MEMAWEKVLSVAMGRENHTCSCEVVWLVG
jgi:hypothetical protein